MVTWKFPLCVNVDMVGQVKSALAFMLRLLFYNPAAPVAYRWIAEIRFWSLRIAWVNPVAITLWGEQNIKRRVGCAADEAWVG